jgi:hypothetical protein
MTTHVFVVNEHTFKVHLEYMFAGTGSGADTVDFNCLGTTELHFSIENKLCGMLADFARTRMGDFVIFYVTASKTSNGRFYGVFQIASNPFIENFDPQDPNAQYLYADLKKNLTFRTLIKPYTVYPKGVTEWAALDSIKNIQKPEHMLWSLIYRKLEGNRGNTMITLYESDRLIDIIKRENGGVALDNAKAFSYDGDDNVIVNTINKAVKYVGAQTPIDLFKRLETKFRACQAFEAHLQAYILQHIGRGTNASLDRAILGGRIPEWIGNEVYCGLGERRIDILISTFSGGIRAVLPIELKAKGASADNVRQMGQYLDWLCEYYLPNLPSKVQPIIIVKKEKTNGEVFKTFPPDILMVEYDIVGDEPVFSRVLK